MKNTGSSDSVTSKCDAAALSAPVKTGDQSGVHSGVVPSVNPAVSTVVSAGSVNPVVNSDGVSGDVNSVKPTKGAPVSSSPGKQVVKTGASSGVRIGVRNKTALSVGDKGKSIVSGEVGEVISFRDVTFGPHEGEVRFRLIHFWEAWNIQTKVLIGVEMLLIDEEANVLQGFIPHSRMEIFMRHIRAGATYRLHKFFGSRSKPGFRVASSEVTISLSWNSVLSVLEDSSICFPTDRFRIHGYEEFDAACDMRGGLYDYLGHIKLVNGMVPTDSFQIDEAELAASRRVDLHVQKHDEPVLKLCLWDKAAFDFCAKFKASGGKARVILATTLNPRRYGVVSLSTMASSRVFLDSDVKETEDYLTWLESNLDVANRVNAEAVIKPEPATLEELFSYMREASAKVAWFECTATIDDVVHGSAWYYIGCGVCHTKAIKGPTTLMCKKCGKSEIDGVAKYLSKLSVYDRSEQAVFVILGAAGEELTGRKASELVESYYQENESVGVDAMVPVPQAMLDTIGQTRKFIVKVSSHNLAGKTRTLTVTKVLPLGVGNVDDRGGEEEENAGELGKRDAEVIESSGAKRSKSG
ncbi:replication protein A 70 kDa DNA-binding subunit A-like [Raphanus sativus]|uniref:Replication protein A 70 kDa DNA-binding subunit A-like n=1 Tax=Raphanus sativus TaxID=3726 RepID=A0A9W3BXE2_RAPSA|nr:replication protein A 70 kDa DNA-binding subunit A-like [Raphanus sativus]